MVIISYYCGSVNVLLSGKASWAKNWVKSHPPIASNGKAAADDDEADWLQLTLVWPLHSDPEHVIRQMSPVVLQRRIAWSPSRLSQTPWGRPEGLAQPTAETSKRDIILHFLILDQDRSPMRGVGKGEHVPRKLSCLKIFVGVFGWHIAIYVFSFLRP